MNVNGEMRKRKIASKLSSVAALPDFTLNALLLSNLSFLPYRISFFPVVKENLFFSLNFINYQI